MFKKIRIKMRDGEVICIETPGTCTRHYGYYHFVSEDLIYVVCEKDISYFKASK